MSYHELAFSSNKPLEININTVDRSLVNKKDIDTDRWYVGEPKESGYYRVLLYDIKPHMYQLNIFYYFYYPQQNGGEWRSNFCSDSKIYKPVPLWQDLNCSSL